MIKYFGFSPSSDIQFGTLVNSLRSIGCTPRLNTVLDSTILYGHSGNSLLLCANVTRPEVLASGIAIIIHRELVRSAFHRLEVGHVETC